MGLAMNKIIGWTIAIIVIIFAIALIVNYFSADSPLIERILNVGEEFRP